MTRTYLMTLVAIASVFSTLLSQQLSLRSELGNWLVLADAGAFPFAGRVGVGWYPSYSLRVGAGHGTESFAAYAFAGYDSFGLSQAGGLHEYLDQNARRGDFTFYPAVWIHRIVFIGAGAFLTHSDHVRITSLQGVSSWTGGDARGIRGFFTVGLTWEFKLTKHVNVPVGMYVRNSGYYADKLLLAFRCGVNLSS